MILGQKLIVVMPAFNAEKTLFRTYDELPHEYVDEVILVDDASNDRTAALASTMGIKTIIHTENHGYGGNQKTCYREALRLGAALGWPASCYSAARGKSCVTDYCRGPLHACHRFLRGRLLPLPGVEGVADAFP